MGARTQALGGFAALAAIVVGVLAMTGTWSATAGGASTGNAPTAGATIAAGRSAQVTTDVVASERGRLLFVSTCASCHGPDGRGGAGGPSLATAGTAAWDFYLRTGRMPLSAPGQPAARQGAVLGDEDIADLVAYGATIGSGPTIPDVVIDAASTQRGRDLFVNDCAACHGAAAGGGAVGPGVFAPSIVGEDPTTVGEAVRIGPGAMPPFAWDDQRISDVAAYLGWLATAPQPGGISAGAQGPVPEGLLAVVVGLGLLVLIARWIGNAAERRR